MANNEYIFVANGTTNTTPNSNVDLYINETTLVWEAQDNLYGDKLPIIPKDSRVEKAKVLYRMQIKVTLRSLITNEPVDGKYLSIQSNRPSDMVSVPSEVSDASGNVMVTLETRDPGELQLFVANTDITSNQLSLTLAEAWFEGGFWVTHYVIADEHDATGPMVLDANVPGLHHQDFLYGAEGVPMQGTGITLDNRFVRFDGGGGGWHDNAAGHPDILKSPQTARLHVTDGAHGRFADVVQDQSIAVDPSVIPPNATVYISSGDGKRIIGVRRADDTGGGIRGDHIDHFSGAGKTATQRWQEAGGDMHNAQVKFLG